ncbi:hypothetical protein ACFTQL_27200 [Peribacillus butanolivorans]|uniref:hypothetical protein n=1 Tax=Peribacillus butanolivorans TaxID=421767 RepID=UPI003644A3C3
MRNLHEHALKFFQNKGVTEYHLRHLNITQSRFQPNRITFEAKLKKVHFVGSKRVVECVSGSQEIVVNLSDEEQMD